MRLSKEREARVSAAVLRHCPMCDRDRPTNRFPRYTSRRPDGAFSHQYGQRCFDCGARPVRTGEQFDEAFAALKPERGVFHTAEEIAEMVGCSKTTVQMLEIAALRKAKRLAPHLASYLEGRP